VQQDAERPDVRHVHAQADAHSRGGCVFRLASDVLPSATLTAAQVKVLSVLRDTFAAEGATKSEWQRTCADVAERSFHRACKVLQERGLVKQFGTHYRVMGGGR
jgi:hypothetical protein